MFQLFGKSRIEFAEKEKIHPEKKPSFCPICGTALKPGQKVKSIVYPGKTDSFVEVYGCPNCYPDKPGVNRLCPACKSVLIKDEFVSGRMFQKESGLKHLHINGCKHCIRK